MPQPIQIAPSILSADFLNLERDVHLIEAGNPEWLHVDVMDGHFVPNLTIGPPIVKSLKKITNIPLDVHLMISNPAEQLDWYLDAGADLVTVHIESLSFALPQLPSVNLTPPSVNATSPSVILSEAKDPAGDMSTKMDVVVKSPGTSHASTLPTSGTSHAITRVDDPAPLIALIDRIHAAGALAGISLNPNTPASVLEPFIALVDLVLVMSVHPGFGGQSFIESSVEKIEHIVALARSAGANPLIEVDGGITAQTAPLVTAKGADVLVAGNAIFGAPDPIAALQEIRDATQNNTLSTQSTLRPGPSV